MRPTLPFIIAGLLGVASLGGCADCSDRPPTLGGPELGAAPADGAIAASADTAAAPSVDEAPDDGEPDPWRELAPPGAGFTVEAPVELAHAVETVSTPTGVAADVHQYMSPRDRGGELYVVTVSPLFLRVPDATDAEAALDTLVAGQRRTDPPPQVRALALDGYPGREVVTRTGAAGDEADVTWRHYVAGQRLYQVTATTRTDAQRARAERFLGSFRLTAEAKGEDDPGPPSAPWTSFTSPDGDLTVSLPRLGVMREGEATTPWGRRAVRSLSVVGAAPAAAYTIVVTPLTEAEATAPIAERLDAWQAHVLASQGSEPTLERRLTVAIAGRSGRVLDVSVSRPDHAASARYLGLPVGDRFYELGFVPLDDFAGAREASRFFDSFRVVAPTE